MDDWWVKDYVSTLKWEWFTDISTAHFWEYCRLRANRKTEKWQGKIVERGSFVSSLSHMAVESGLSEKQIRLAISKLEKTGEITTERTNKYTLITVVKYAHFQGNGVSEGKQKGKPQGKQRADEGQTKDKQRATIIDIENLENIENLEKKENTKERSGFVKPTLEDVRSYCQERNRGVDPDKWFNYYSANGWKVGKNPMKDWKACVRTWEKNIDPIIPETHKSSYEEMANAWKNY